MPAAAAKDVLSSVVFRGWSLLTKWELGRCFCHVSFLEREGKGRFLNEAVIFLFVKAVFVRLAEEVWQSGNEKKRAI